MPFTFNRFLSLFALRVCLRAFTREWTRASQSLSGAVSNSLVTFPFKLHVFRGKRPSEEDDAKRASAHYSRLSGMYGKYIRFPITVAIRLLARLAGLAEVIILLEEMEETVPCGGNEWRLVHKFAFLQTLSVTATRSCMLKMWWWWLGTDYTDYMLYI
jgi:hypothetical protein